MDLRGLTVLHARHISTSQMLPRMSWLSSRLVISFQQRQIVLSKMVAPLCSTAVEVLCLLEIFLLNQLTTWHQTFC